MGSHKKKKYESDSSSSDSEVSSSSSDASKKNKKKHAKKTKYPSSEDSEDEKYKSKRKRSSSDRDGDKTVGNKRNEKDHYPEKYKEEKYDDRYKEKHKLVDRSKSREKERFRDNRQIDENRSRRHYSREKSDYQDKHRKYDYRRGDNWSKDGNSREHKSEEGTYRSRDKGGIRDRRDNKRDFRQRRSSSFDHANAKWGKNMDDKKFEKNQTKEKPNFKLSGKLTEETNTFKGIVVKYSEPPEARKPRRRWRLYPFKGEKALQTLYIHRESAYLIGRERKVVDLPVDHPSCSKQHAALQYRLVSFTRDDGSAGKRVRPYIIDLESANGTFINNKKIDSRKYVELFEKDVIKFGFSSREYVLLHENSKDEALDDDVKQEEEPIKEEPL